MKYCRQCKIEIRNPQLPLGYAWNAPEVRRARADRIFGKWVFCSSQCVTIFGNRHTMTLRDNPYWNLLSERSSTRATKGIWIAGVGKVLDAYQKYVTSVPNCVCGEKH